MHVQRCCGQSQNHPCMFKVLANVTLARARYIQHMFTARIRWTTISELWTAMDDHQGYFTALLDHPQHHWTTHTLDSYGWSPGIVHSATGPPTALLDHPHTGQLWMISRDCSQHHWTTHTLDSYGWSPGIVHSAPGPPTHWTAMDDLQGLFTAPLDHPHTGQLWMISRDCSQHHWTTHTLDSYGWSPGIVHSTTGPPTHWTAMDDLQGLFTAPLDHPHTGQLWMISRDCPQHHWTTVTLDNYGWSPGIVHSTTGPPSHWGSWTGEFVCCSI